MDMWEAHEWRERRAMLPLAYQTFLTQAMFSKDITLEMIVKAFDAVCGFRNDE